MSDKKTALPSKPAKAPASRGAPQGRIVYNPNLDSWRCIDRNNKMVLSTGSKQDAINAYPNFIVKG